jgi:hypothetical protein
MRGPLLVVVRILVLLALVWAGTVEQCVANASVLWRESACSWGSPATQIGDEVASQSIPHTDLGRHDPVTPLSPTDLGLAPAWPGRAIDTPLTSRLSRSPPTA